MGNVIDYIVEKIRKSILCFSIEGLEKMSDEQIAEKLGFPNPYSNFDEWMEYCRKAMKILHPDNNPNNQVVSEIFKRISAYRDLVKDMHYNNDKSDFSNNSYQEKSYENRYESTSRKEELDNEYKNLGIGCKFCRSDGSEFSLVYVKYWKGLNDLIDKGFYQYIFIDENSKKRFLYTELSPRYYILRLNIKTTRSFCK